MLHHRERFPFACFYKCAEPTACLGTIICRDSSDGTGDFCTDSRAIMLRKIPTDESGSSNTSSSSSSSSLGIALSDDFQTVYYCEISRQILWSVPTHALSNWSMNSNEIGTYVINVGTKGFSDGMTHDVIIVKILFIISFFF